MKDGSPLGPDEVTDFWKLYDAIAEWVRFADAKIGAVIAVAGVVLALTLNALSSLLGRACVNWLVVFLGLFTVLGLIGSASFCAAALWPRLNPKEDPASLIYFDHIAKRYPQPNASDYEADLKEAISQGQLATEIIHQVHSLAGVARTKYRLLAIATRLLLISIGVGTIAWLLTLLDH